MRHIPSLPLPPATSQTHKRAHARGRVVGVGSSRGSGRCKATPAAAAPRVSNQRRACRARASPLPRTPPLPPPVRFPRSPLSVGRHQSARPARTCQGRAPLSEPHGLASTHARTRARARGGEGEQARGIAERSRRLPPPSPLPRLHSRDGRHAGTRRRGAPRRPRSPGPPPPLPLPPTLPRPVAPPSPPLPLPRVCELALPPGAARCRACGWRAGAHPSASTAAVDELGLQKNGKGRGGGGRTGTRPPSLATAYGRGEAVAHGAGLLVGMGVPPSAPSTRAVSPPAARQRTGGEAAEGSWEGGRRRAGSSSPAAASRRRAGWGW